MEYILASIITAIIGPVLILLAKPIIEDTDIPASSGKRRSQLQGEWSGYFQQKLNGQIKRFDVNLVLRNQWRNRIKGKVKYKNSQQKSVCLIMYDGVFYNDSILKIEYRNELPRIFQRGSVLARLNAKGDEIQGKFVGFSPDQEGIIEGDVFCSNSPHKTGKKLGQAQSLGGLLPTTLWR